ncbi:MAG: TRAP transporter substrate-binding protein DctP [Pararhodobacter sp.]|nr:TRAP transporter substrate-binding protein DctP [Pararhodobacter sp.]
MNRQVTALVGGAGLLALAAAHAPAEANTRIQMTTTWPPIIDLIDSDRHFVELVNRLGEGNIEIEFHPGESIIPSTQVFDAVSSGAIEASGDWAGYWAGANSAFSLIGSFPMLFSAIDYVLWIREWGGAELIDEVYGQHNIKYLPYAVITTESGLRSRTPITSLDDMSGRRMRMSGRPQGAILERLGAAQVMVPGSEIYQALERGVVDAIEFSGPSTDLGLGFQEITSYWLAPGWHQPASMAGVMINRDVWDGFTDQQRFILETAAAATMTWSLGHFERNATEAIRTFEEAGTTIHTLNDEEFARLQTMANEVLVDEACRNPLHARLTLSMLTFLEDYSQWRDMQGTFALGRNLSEMPDIEAVRACAE